MLWFGLVWFGLVWFGFFMSWFGLVCSGLVWFGDNLLLGLLRYTPTCAVFVLVSLSSVTLLCHSLVVLIMH